MTQNLIKLVAMCEEKDVCSLEMIVAELFQTGTFSTLREDILECCWEAAVQESNERIESNRATPSLPASSSTSAAQADVDKSIGCTRLGATLRIIGMIAKFSPDAMTPERINLLIQTAFHAHVYQENDFSTLRAACICLQTTAPYIFTVSKTTPKSVVYNEKKHQLLRKALISTAPFLRDILLAGNCHSDEELSGSVLL